MSNRWKVWAIVGATAMFATAWRYSPTADAQPKAAGDAQALAKRGDYLVNQVARCGDCHTPRDAKAVTAYLRSLRGDGKGRKRERERDDD
jgi:mono/diheme cytochrome c family protein